MPSFMHFFLFLLLIWAAFFGPLCINGRIFSFKLHHRFSDSIDNLSNASHWPPKGTFEYYAVLAHNDRLLRGRHLADTDTPPLSFADGNSTLQINALGFLHYATIQLGTPGVKFMVALDTGSDLFWVPCECNRCAPIQDSYTSDFKLTMYYPEESSTSKNVTCDNSLCEQHTQCPESISNCPYAVSYVSAQTSTSGVLVEDVLHLTREDNNQSVEAYVTFGCGQDQTGSFLDIAAPNGLFGLGMEKISVPSILSGEGLTANSFSMCFGSDGIGRISLGDMGSSDQEETPFNLNPLHPTYNITVTQIQLGAALIDVDLTALFDTGTSFTYLVDPTYTKLSENFHSQIKDRRRLPDPKIPFEYCYDASPNVNTSLVPNMSLKMKGGSYFAIDKPIFAINSQSGLVYCLAVIKGTELNIIGQHFMTGYRVVFDRERLVLGWKKFDCYDIEDSYNLFQGRPHSTSVPPAVAAELGHNSSTDSNKKTRNHARNSEASLSDHSSISFLPLFCSVILLVLLF